jgi:hypothetical protein
MVSAFLLLVRTPEIELFATEKDIFSPERGVFSTESLTWLPTILEIIN